MNPADKKSQKSLKQRLTKQRTDDILWNGLIHADLIGERNKRWLKKFQKNQKFAWQVKVWVIYYETLQIVQQLIENWIVRCNLENSIWDIGNDVVKTTQF